jgi:hypothetical protein
VRCLRCSAPQDLVVFVSERGLPPADPAHDTVHDWSKVLSCPGCGYGDLRAFSHDCWPWEEDVDMEWSTSLPPDQLALIVEGLAVCPDPAVPTCECPLHTSLRDSVLRPAKLRIQPWREGTRPDGFVARRADGVPEFVATPPSR